MYKLKQMPIESILYDSLKTNLRNYNTILKKSNNKCQLNQYCTTVLKPTYATTTLYLRKAITLRRKHFINPVLKNIEIT